jgi:hypothetical protein
MRPIRWLIWPRQYGKSYEIESWWLEDPEHRVILCTDTVSASYRISVLTKRLQGRDHVPGLRVTKGFMESRVMSWRTWVHKQDKPGYRSQDEWEVAIDEVGPLLAELLKTDIRIIAGVGRVEEPDPERKAMVDDFHAKHAHMFPPGIDGSIM